MSKDKQDDVGPLEEPLDVADDKALPRGKYDGAIPVQSVGEEEIGRPQFTEEDDVWGLGQPGAARRRSRG